MTQLKPADLDQALETLLAVYALGDVSVRRAARLRKVSKAKRKELDELLDALDGAILALDARAESLLHPPDPALEPAEPIDAEASIEDTPEQTAEAEEAPSPPARVRKAPPSLVQPSEGWTLRSELLFEDALRLFSIGDSDGALVSLERLLTSTELNDDLHEFVSVNEEKLLRVYEEVLGPWERVLARDENADPMPPAFFATPKIASVLEHIKGTVTIQEVLDQTEFSQLETVAVISQLLRAKALHSSATAH